jgi:hemerythrin-like domain-containing protein
MSENEQRTVAISAIATLRAEHAVIREVLRSMTRALDGGGSFDDESFWRDTLTFLQTFADGSHQQKEESVLFPRLEMRGVARVAGPIGVMLAEHDQLRALLRTMAALLSDVDAHVGSRELFERTAREYCELLALHMAREDGVLFPLAERVLSAEDMHDVLQRFRLLERGSGDPHARGRLFALADRIRRAA